MNIFIKLSFLMVGMTYDAPFLQISRSFFVHDLVFIFAIAAYAVQNGFRFTPRIPRPWVFLVSLFISWHLVSVLFSFSAGYPNAAEEFFVFLRFIYLFTLMIFASIVVEDAKRLKEALWYFCGGVLIISAVAAYNVMHATGGQQLANFYYRIGEHKGSVINANTLTIQTSLACPAVLAFLFEESSLLKKWAYFLFFIFLAAVTFFTFSKGGWTGALIGTASSLFLYGRRTGALKLALTIIILSGLVFYSVKSVPFLNKVPAAVEHRLTHGQMSGSLSRINYVGDTFKLLSDEPGVALFTGVGFKNYNHLTQKHSLQGGGGNPHNLASYLVIGVGLGGAMLAHLFFLMLFRDGLKYRTALPGAIGGAIAPFNVLMPWLLVSMWFSLIAAYPIFSHVFWLMAGMMGRCIYNAQRGI